MGFFWELTKKALWAVITTEPKKKEDPNVIKNGDWEVHLKEDGTPHWFYKKSKEWFDANKTWASPSKKFFVHFGFDGESDYSVALTTQNEGLKLKKNVDDVETAFVTDEGMAYALSDEGILYILSPEKISQRKVCSEDDSPEEYILTPQIVAVAWDDGEAMILRAIDLNTGKSWKKTLKYYEDNEDEDEESEIEYFAAELKDKEGRFEVKNYNGEIYLFSYAGEPIKE